MGLAVEVGVLADLLDNDEEGAEWLRESLANVNAVLAENKLPAHVEPEELPPLGNRSVLASFPYSYLHYLRRAYAHFKQHPDVPLTLCDDEEDLTEDPVVDDEASLFTSHLLCHSDCEGFYVPIPFKDVLVDETNQDRIDGGLLGSSYQLIEELRSVAHYLRIRLENGELCDSVAEQVCSDVEAESDFWIERGVWLTLFEAARLSVQHKTAIVFH